MLTRPVHEVGAECGGPVWLAGVGGVVTTMAAFTADEVDSLLRLKSVDQHGVRSPKSSVVRVAPRTSWLRPLATPSAAANCGNRC